MLNRRSMMSLPTSPSFNTFSNDNLRDNPNAPKVRFIRKNGRVIPIVAGKKSNAAASDLNARLAEMKKEVLHATPGHRLVNQTQHGTKAVFSPSTFPGFYGQLKFRNKGDFLKAISGGTNKSDDLIRQAHEDLSHGYESKFSGHAGPVKSYRVATKQTFDNTNVIFRRINGRIVPIRIAKKRAEAADEVPF